jgi:hypothetical protein
LDVGKNEGETVFRRGEERWGKKFELIISFSLPSNEPFF